MSDQQRPQVSHTQSGYNPYAFINAQGQTSSDNNARVDTSNASRGHSTADPSIVHTFQEPQQPIEGLDRQHDVPEVALERDMYPQGRGATITHDNTSRVSTVPLSNANREKPMPPAPSHQTASDISVPKDTRSANTARNNDKSNNSRYPYPDLVLVFALPAPDGPREEWQDAEQEYRRLKKRLDEAGLLSIAKTGSKGRNERLILVKGVQSVIRAEAQSEKLTDWLNTLRGAAAQDDPNLPRDFKKRPFFPAERARHVATVLERALVVLNNPKPFPRLKSYFPPHDPEFNSTWLTQWTSGLKIQIPEEQILQVRYHFGDGVALYFEFLRFYFLSLAFPSFVGLTTWLGGYHFSRLYSTLIVIWSIAFVEAWKLRERQLSVRWGTYGLSKQPRVRIGFRAQESVTSAITGEKIPHSPWWRRELRTSASIPIVFGFAAGLALVISIIFGIEVIVNEVYGGPGKSLLSFLPMALFATFVPQIVGLWYDVAKDLTLWENHPTEASQDKSLTLKMFALNGIVSFGALTLTAYVYLPFGAFVVPKIVGFLRGSVSEQTVSKSSFDAPIGFAASPSRLTNTLFALMTTTQAVGFFQETGLPYLQRKFVEVQKDGFEAAFKPSKQNTTKNPDGKKVQRATTAKGESGDDWLERIRAEVALPPYSLFSDYAEMVVQFGHVVLFSTAWPLAPVAALINNFVELRGDSFKLCINSRRPVPTRSDTIGPWLEALGWITYLGALTNASLCYLLRPYIIVHPHSTALEVYVDHSDAVNSTAQASIAAVASSSPVDYKTTRIGAAQADYTSIKSLIFGAMLCALASEHGYLLLRKIAAHLMDKLLWEGSMEEVTLRQKEWSMRKDYVESQGGREFEGEIERLQGRREKDIESFNDEAWKEEDRGVREEMERKRQ